MTSKERRIYCVYQLDLPCIWGTWLPICKKLFTIGKVFFVIKANPSQIRCPDCDSWHVVRKGTQTRYCKTLPISKKPVVFIATLQSIQCLDCHCIKQVKLGLADLKKSYTLAFARDVLTVLQFSTIHDIAHHLGVS